MKNRLYFFVFCLLFLAGPGAWADGEQTLSLPPASLAQWYKPQNKRQVWLHTMFQLRREMLAVSDYADRQDGALLKKWADRLVEHYRKIGEMVPEWRNELVPDWAARLQKAAANGDFTMIRKAQQKLEDSCNGCHRKFRAQAAVLYRVPDYDEIELTDNASGRPISFALLMEELSITLNRIKIASEDGRREAARKSTTKLGLQLKDLGASCNHCHQDQEPFNRILGPETQQTLSALARSIEQGEKQETGRLLGEAAVATCARCHGIHRTLADIRNAILPMGGQN